MTKADMESFAVNLTDQSETHDDWLSIVRYGLGTLTENQPLFFEIIWREVAKMQKRHGITGRVVADDARQIFQELDLRICPSEPTQPRISTVVETDQVRVLANGAIDKLFREQGWKRQHALTSGDVNAVIDAWEELKSNQVKGD